MAANSLLRRAFQILLWIFSQAKGVLARLEAQLCPIVHSSDPLKLQSPYKCNKVFKWSFVATSWTIRSCATATPTGQWLILNNPFEAIQATLFCNHLLLSFIIFWISFLYQIIIYCLPLLTCFYCSHLGPQCAPPSIPHKKGEGASSNDPWSGLKRSKQRVCVWYKP